MSLIVHVGCVLHLVQRGHVEEAQRYKKEAEEWEDKVKKNEEHLKNLGKKREQYESELGVVLWNSVNTMQADLDTHTRLGQCLSPCPHIV